MSKRLTEKYLSEASSELTEAKASIAKEKRRVRFVAITTRFFIALIVPPLAWFFFQGASEAYYQSVEHSESVAHANLLRRGRRGDAIGAEQQRPLDVMTARQYLQESNLRGLEASYQARVNALLEEHNEALRSQRLSVEGQEDARQGWYRRFIGHPKQLVVKSLTLKVTKNYHLLADLRIHGEPLGDDYWAQFFITDPAKLAWLFTWDNKLRANGQQTLRHNIKHDLVSHMQAKPAPSPRKPARPCLAIDKSQEFTKIGAKLALAQRLDDLQTLDKLNFDLDIVYVDQGENPTNQHAKAKVHCMVGHLSRGHVNFEAILCLTSVKQNTWKVISTNAPEIKDPDNRNDIQQCIDSLSRLSRFLNFD